MLDIFNIPGQQNNVSIFYARGTTDWQTWNKPRNCKFIWIMCIGGGCGGSGGGTTNVGGGGGAGGVCRILYPSQVLPDTLYVQPGPGSLGAVGSSISTANGPSIANSSYVSIAATGSGNQSIAMNLVCISGTAEAGTTSVVNGETAATVTVANLMSLGTFTANAGQNGDNVANYPTPLSSSITSGGRAGGASGVAGSTISSINLGLYTTPQISGGSSTGGNADNGIWYWKPTFGIGGAGGGGNAGTTGGNGGNGAYGCGGGGGGVGATTGGKGGNGGGGLVIIATF